MAEILINQKPPIFDQAAKIFGVTEKDVIFYSWGDKIYSPSGRMPSDDILIHEGTHAEQQRHGSEGAAEWWRHYMADAEWRIGQEAEAFGEQLKWLRRRYRDRNAVARIVHQMASSLSGRMYGSAISHAAAAVLIRAYADGTVLTDIEGHMGDDGSGI